jgi:hypothetical protein
MQLAARDRAAHTCASEAYKWTAGQSVDKQRSSAFGNAREHVTQPARSVEFGTLQQRIGTHCIVLLLLRREQQLTIAGRVVLDAPLTHAYALAPCFLEAISAALFA